MNEHFSALMDTEPLYHLIESGAVIYFCVGLLMLWFALVVKNKAVSFHLHDELTQKDNKAVGIATAGYLLGVMIVIRGVLVSDADADFTLNVSLASDVGMTIVWSIISILLLLLSAILNDRFLLSQFCNREALIDGRNVGAGAVIAASYIGTALLISSAVNGVSDSGFLIEVLDTLLYFLAGQCAFILTGIIYQKFTTYNIHDEIKRGNVAAGVSLAMTLLAVSILLSGYLLRSDSLIGFVAWIPISILLMQASRFLIDRVLLPQSSMQHEIANDQNWGVALLEGCVSVGIALVLNASFA